MVRTALYIGILNLLLLGGAGVYHLVSSGELQDTYSIEVLVFELPNGKECLPFLSGPACGYKGYVNLSGKFTHSYEEGNHPGPVRSRQRQEHGNMEKRASQNP